MQARRRAVRAGRRVGVGRPAGPARHRRRAGALRRLRALRRRRALRPHRRARHPRRRQPGDPRRRRQRGVRARLLDVDDHRGVPQPAGGVGAREGRRRPGVGVLHPAALLRARGLRLPRGHRPGRVRARGARGGAADAALGRRRPGHLQVRPRRGDDLDAAHAAHPRPRLDRPGHRQGRRGLAPRRGGRVPARPRHDRAPDGGQDVRGRLRHRHRQGRRARARRTSTTWSTTPTRCATTAPSAWCGRPRSTRSWPSSCSPPAPGRAPACSAPRRCRRGPFLDLLAAPKPEGYGSPWGIEDRTKDH